MKAKLFKKFNEIKMPYVFCFINYKLVDPIEQFDLGLFTVYGFKVYPAYLHVFLLFFLFFILSRRLELNIFAYINSKLFGLIKKNFINIFGLEKQSLFPYFYFIFLTILLGNLLGMFPWSFTFTAQLVTVFFFSVISLGGVVILSVEQKGWNFFSIFKPNAPRSMEHFLILIEFTSFMVRFISLAVRLFANMVAGHALLKILLLFVTLMFSYAGAFTILGGVIGFFIVLAIIILEVLIAFLQAYVFVFLVLVYSRELLP